MKKETKNPHIGHRERMLSRLDRVGSEAFEDHELLEALLFYALPRVNTNEIAHALMDKFASLDRVMSASIDALSSVDGISKKTARLIQLAFAISKRMSAPKESVIKNFDVEIIGNFLVEKHKFETKESVSLLMFDNSCKYISMKKLSEGSVNSSDVDVRKIAEFSLACNAGCIMLAHNHPYGVAEPSEFDITVTRAVRRSLAMINLNLVEHFVVAPDGYVALFASKILNY